MGQQVTGCSDRRQGPPAQMARSDRRRFTPATGTRASRRALMSSVTVSSLSTAGPAPARTADRTAAVVDSASATGMVDPGAQGGGQGRREHAAGPGPLFPADDARRGQFGWLERLAAPRPGVIGPDDHDQLVVADDAAAKALRPGTSHN